MDKKIIKFYDTEIEEYELHQNKSPISILLVSNKFPFGKQDFKYFVGYKDNKKIKRMHIE